MVFDVTAVRSYTTTFFIAGVVGFLVGLSWSWLRGLFGDISET